MESEILNDNHKSSVEVKIMLSSVSTKEKVDDFGASGVVIDTDPKENSDLSEFSNFPLRKKKKKVLLASFQQKIPSIETLDDSNAVSNNFSGVPIESTKTGNLDVLFDFSQKKKKPKHLLKVDEDLVSSEEIQILDKEPPPVLDNLLDLTDSDYTYEYLLSRFYRTAELDLPRIDQDLSMKVVLKPPQVLRLGSKKTLFANLSEICRSVHRPPQHLISFIFAELGTCGSVDGNNHLVIRGRFQQNQISNIIRRYVMEYVKCATCNSMNTFIQKRIRLYFLTCENCNSERSVANIKSGFQAITAKRAALRAKTLT